MADRRHLSYSKYPHPWRRRCRIESLESRHLLSAEPLISEFMASNSSTLQDQFGNYSDWIEIYNASDEPIDLNGWYLTDDIDHADLWQFPEIQLAAQKALVVRASGQGVTEQNELHTDFRLQSTGEYLALLSPDKAVVHEYADTYPRQRADVSYGVEFNGDLPLDGEDRYFDLPTPGTKNSAGLRGQAAAVDFSVARGYFEQPFTVELSSPTSEGEIRYTTDGSVPTQQTGTRFEVPINIDGTTTLRAVAFRDGLLGSEVATQTYIFLEDVLTQSGEGLPEEWGFYDDLGPQAPARAPANYEMDPDVVNDPIYAPTIKDDLQALPTLSVVLDPHDLWDLETGIYSNPYPGGRGDLFERPASLEWIDTEGETVFQQNAGIRIHGGWGRRFSQNRKLSFRAVFQGKYGEPTLDVPLFGEGGQQEFASIVLRAGFNDQFRNGNRAGTGTESYMNDQWTRQAQNDIGGYASRSNYVHLYLNGLYWGLYSPTERPDSLWASSTRGGEPEQYDVLNTGGNVIDGNDDAWQEFMAYFTPDTFDYNTVVDLLDIENFADYLVVQQFVGNWDWPQNNWYASRQRVPDGKWYFHVWDAEGAFTGGTGEDRVNITSDVVGPARLYSYLKEVPEFQSLMADRIQFHLFGQGQLSEENNKHRWLDLAAQFHGAIIGEIARWGDGFLNNIPYPSRQSWHATVENRLHSYFPKRMDWLMRQYRLAELYPSIDAPSIEPVGGQIPGLTPVTVSTDQGDLYVTLDGTDPMTADGQVTEQAFRLNSVELIGPNNVGKYRAANGDTDWRDLEFDDTTWSDASTAVGYDTGESEDPIQLPNGFTVTAHLSSTRLDSFDEVDQVLNGEHLEQTEVLSNVPYIRFNEINRSGAPVIPFPFGNEEGRVDNVVLDVTAKIVVKRPGTYTFGITSNDGARLFLDDKLVYADPKRHSTRKTVQTVQLTEGEHELQLTSYERTGNGVLELYYAPGRKNEFDETFLLMADSNRSFDSLIDTDVSAVLSGNPSMHIRYPFTVSPSDKVRDLQLRVRYDAGIVVYLNGGELYRRFEPRTPGETTATGSLVDEQAMVVQLLDLDGSQLRDGENVLAVQTFNEFPDETDLLLTVNLIGWMDYDPLEISTSTTIRARTLVGDLWSAVAQADFVVSTPATADNLRISEVHYHPEAPSETETAAGFDDADDFEFIELVNISDQEIELNDVRLVRVETEEGLDGVEFDFSVAEIQRLQPGQRVLVVEDRAAFRNRYGASHLVAGEWSGGLNNATEQITLMAGEQVIHQFVYRDDWYPQTDGGGSSLERTDPAGTLEAWSTSTAWFPSGAAGGSPGESGFPAGDANRDGVFDMLDLSLVAQSGKLEDDLAQNVTWEEGDWDGDGKFTTEDLVFAFIGGMPSQNRSPAGDANRDGVFNTVDLSLVALSGKLEDDQAQDATWEEGDWDGDGKFTTEDLVFAFITGNFVNAG